jgi:HTH-type transcriptional regulator / antitoxin HigA
MAQMVRETATLDPVKYGRLCAKALPKVIASAREFDRMAEHLEALTFKANPSAEERALAGLLTQLIETYDDLHYPLPEIPPHEMVAYLMRQRGLKQTDLVELIGSRAQVSDLVGGKRSISKAQAKKLAAFFKVSTDLFL